ncbi:MAG: folate-binding protein YgfZ [Acidobacteria bacterium]|nr:folate-binding protein YgfZ [Acidobacteriota bacterium]MBW4043409.1 folate-binding protein YgfZ [Acidobacteriota bacterium]
MSDVLQAAAVSPETPFAPYLIVRQRGASLTAHQGSSTVRSIVGQEHEFNALLQLVGIHDLGHRRRIRVTGEDRLRWLNGMLTNAVQTLPQGHWNYSLLLNAQGRIQGDCNVFQSPNEVFLETDASQVRHIFEHLDRFIIMDDVTLEEPDSTMTALGFVGPHAAQTLERLGLPVPGEQQFTASGVFTVVRAYGVVVPHYTVWLPIEELDALLDKAALLGADLCGLDATEALRVLEAVPLYGVDILERHLPQETNQKRALNFSKGCYLGQEIVERIRSRATVHRSLRQFELTGSLPAPGAVLKVGETAVGGLSSVAACRSRIFALGFIRNEPVDRGDRIDYEGGTAMPLNAPPSMD